MKKLEGALTICLAACSPQEPDRVPISQAEMAELAAAVVAAHDKSAEIVPDQIEVKKDALTKEQLEVVESIRKLDAHLKTKYKDTGWGAKGFRTHIKTPTGKRLAVSIQGNGWVVNINPDNSYHTLGGKWEVLDFAPSMYLEDYSDPDTTKKRNERYAKSNEEKYPELAEVYRRHTWALERDFDGNGFAGVNSKGGAMHYTAVFKAFGFTPETLAWEKAKVVVSTLNEQL